MFGMFLVSRAILRFVCSAPQNCSILNVCFFVQVIEIIDFKVIEIIDFKENRVEYWSTLT